MKEGLRMKLINSHGRIPMPPPYEGSMSNASMGEWGSHAPISFTHYKIFGQMQHQISVVKDPKIVAIVFSQPFFWLNVVALVTAAIGECNGLCFSCDTYPLYCNTFDTFATPDECCNNSNCNQVWQ
jgi:hypothetical protein